MTATRPMHIYQDFSASCDSLDDYAASLPPPLPHGVSYDPRLTDNAVLHPPTTASSAISPCKPGHQAQGAPPRPVLADRKNVLLAPPKKSPFRTDSPAKPHTGSYQPIAPQKLPRPIFTSFPVKEPGKENVRPGYRGENVANFPDPNYGYKAPLKRPSSALTATSHPPNSRSSYDEPPIEIPAPGDLSTPEDDGKKPMFSYATLIGMAILRAPNRRLTLAQIYKWISDHFSHYKADDAGWKNSIRHNLSLCKSFEKKERAKDDSGPGKGNYWTIVPGDEAQFLRKDKPIRRSASAVISNKSSSDVPSSPWPLPRLPSANMKLASIEVQEPSSDATIPASEPTSPANDEDLPTIMPPPALHGSLSSPLQDIQSSPPVAHSPYSHAFSHSLNQEVPLPTVHTSRAKRIKFASMDDSGYFSSLGSSTTKPSTTINTEKLKRPKSRNGPSGRAEEEIARMRSSSHDISPTKGHSAQQTLQLVTSSPIRNLENALMLPPLTPGMTFKIPNKPPASISPNTNLRNHRNRIRELVGSPVKSGDLFNDQISFSPAFKIYQDDSYEDFGSTLNGLTPKPGMSPAAFITPYATRSTRGRRVFGANSSARALADVTGSNLNGHSMFPPPYLGSPLKNKSPEESPSKGSLSMSIEGGQENDVFGSGFFVNDDDDTSTDLLQGFAKIGGQKSKLNTKSAKTSRPALGPRSQTSIF